MQLQQVLTKISLMAEQEMIPRGISAEGRIFSLGLIENNEATHGRVLDIVQGLKDHVGQPFDLHPWAFTFELSTLEQDGHVVPLRFLGIVEPHSARQIACSEFLLIGSRMRRLSKVYYEHGPDGTNVYIPGMTPDQIRDHTQSYPIAISMLNTRGCNIDLKRAPSILNEKRKRAHKPMIPQHYDVDAQEYLAALKSNTESAANGGHHASPLPHIRRAHERIMSDGRRIWVRSSLVNVRSEGDIAFVERRKGYKK